MRFLERVRMNAIAANHTARGTRPAQRAPCVAFVEDLGWPAPQPPADKKPARPVGVWVPGRDIDWLRSHHVDCRAAASTRP